MMGELLAIWFGVLWAMTAACLWLTKATVKSMVWVIKAPFRFRRGYNDAAEEQAAE